MKTRKPSHSQFVICVDNSEYPASLELHKLYRILPDEEAALDGDIRVIDESGRGLSIPGGILRCYQSTSSISPSPGQVI